MRVIGPPSVTVPCQTLRVPVVGVMVMEVLMGAVGSMDIGVTMPVCSLVVVGTAQIALGRRLVTLF